MASTQGSLCLEALRAPTGIALVPASADAIRARAPKVLTSGETLDFRTLVPQPGGLFDYKVFGPGTVIDAPVPDLDAPAQPPRTRFARLVLPAPLVHPLAVAHAPARVAALAGWNEDELRECHAAGAVGVPRGEAPQSSVGEPSHRRLGELAAALDASPEGRAFVIRELPVLPPDLRPLTRLADDRWQTSPINELYRHVMRRTYRLAKAIDGGGPPELIDAEVAGVHAALLHLFENEDCAEPLRDVRGELLTSLRGLAGPGLFDALGAAAAGAPITGRLHRASAVLFALGFELAP